jgi:hypothetical protein
MRTTIEDPEGVGMRRRQSLQTADDGKKKNIKPLPNRIRFRKTGY